MADDVVAREDEAHKNGLAQFAKDEAVGIAKEVANTVLGITNLVDNGINAALGTNLHNNEFQSATPGEKGAMAGTGLALLLVPGGGEANALSKGEKITQLTAEAEKLYPKLAGKADQLHHITPQYLGGAKDGPLSRISAAYHQSITNAFRELAPYGQKFQGSVQKLLDNVYSRFPLP